LNRVSERLFVGAPSALPPITVDVLVANILAAPLIELAPAFAARVEPNGALVLSGVLNHQTSGIVTAFERHFGAFEVATSEGWARVTARRNAG
jgi:ribosomal protein L11 methyltransferase